MSAPPTAFADDEAAQLLRVLSHPARLEIIRLTSRDELAVADVAALLGVSQPLTSQHLRVLRDSDLVSVRTDGNRRLYRANRERAAQIRAFLDDLWMDSLLDLKAEAERRFRSDRGSRS